MVFINLLAFFQTKTLKEMNDLVFIGIDPSFRKDGLGVAFLNGNSVVFEKRTLIEFLEVLFTHSLENWVVCIENSNLTNATFNPKGSLNVKLKRSRDAGKNQAVSQLIFDICKDRAKEVIQVSPKQKGAKWTQNKTMLAVAKTENHRFNKTRFNQDERDAYKLLLIGKRIFELKQKIK